MEQRHIALIRLKGQGNSRPEIVATFKALRLFKKQYCTIIPNTPEYVGMLRVIKDCATWGEISPDVFKQLLLKRGRLARKKSLTEVYVKEHAKMSIDDFVKSFFSFKSTLTVIPGLKLFFRLSPPRKGLEKKGVKADYSLGGALGYRKDQINDLLMRMI